MSKPFSPGLDVAWQIAVSEAIQTKREFVEPEHLFIGTCKLGQLMRNEQLLELGLQDKAAAYLKDEWHLAITITNRTTLFIAPGQVKRFSNRPCFLSAKDRF